MRLPRVLRASLLPLTSVALLAVGARCVAQAGGAAENKSSQPIRRTLLAQSDIAGMPGWETRLYLIEYAPGVAAPLHHHTAAGVGYVLSGTVDSQFEKGAVQSFHAGQAFVDEADAAHLISRNTDSGAPLRLLIAYTVKKGEAVTVTP